MQNAPKTEDLHRQMVAWRHDFHRHPELGFEEKRTSARVAELLSDAGLEVHTGLGGTGVVGVLQKGNAKRTVGIRADMDALPITEATGFSYASETPGVMHACGHDGHTAMLLGAATHLAKSGDFNGRVVFIFQPNEENGLGSPAMIKDGLFEKFPVDEVYAMHNMPGMPVGAFATRAGPITASESLFEIEVHAQGGHAALPHMGVDAITVGTEIVVALQTIVARKLDPGMNGVVSVTEFVTDGRRNVLPGHALIKGDARALTPETTALIDEKMRQIVSGIAMAHGVEAEVRFTTEFPPTINDGEAARYAVEAARRLDAIPAVEAASAPKLFSEDFAHMAAHVPGCFVLLGNGTSENHARPLHSNDYDFNDALLVPGSSYWVELVESRLPSE